MKLYKILRLTYDKGVSFFPAETEELPTIESMAGEPMSDLIHEIVFRGYSEHDARLAVQGWAYHAKFDLNQGARGVRVFCGMCVRELGYPVVPVPSITWPIIIGAAVLAAVALGLYTWVVLGVDNNVITEGHPHAYFMTYEEEMYAAEVWNVGLRQEGVYEKCAMLLPTVTSFRRDVWHVPGMDWIYFAYPGIVIEGRRRVFWHVYRIHFLELFYCGLLTNYGRGMYKLLPGGQDRWKPRGPWIREGTRYCTYGYAGCWGDFWWM